MDWEGKSILSNQEKAAQDLPQVSENIPCPFFPLHPDTAKRPECTLLFSLSSQRVRDPAWDLRPLPALLHSASTARLRAGELQQHRTSRGCHHGTSLLSKTGKRGASFVRWLLVGVRSEGRNKAAVVGRVERDRELQRPSLHVPRASCPRPQPSPQVSTHLAPNPSDLRKWLSRRCPFVFALSPETLVAAPVVSSGIFVLVPGSRAGVGFSFRPLQVSDVIKCKTGLLLEFLPPKHSRAPCSGPCSERIYALRPHQTRLLCFRY